MRTEGDEDIGRKRRRKGMKRSIGQMKGGEEVMKIEQERGRERKIEQKRR